MTLEVNGFGGRPQAAPEPVPQSPAAAPVAAPVSTQPQATPGAMQPPQAPQSTPAPAVTPASTPIVVFGRQFDSPQAVEEYTRHMVRSAENRNKSEIERLRVQTQTPQPTAQPAPQPPPAPEPEEGAYDPKTYSLVKAQYGEEAAEHYRSLAIAESQKNLIEKTLSARLAPIEEQDREKQFETEAIQLFGKATEAIDRSTGIPLFPELRSQAEAQAIVEIWQDLPIEFARTPKGVWHAVMTYRGVKARTAMPSMPPPPGPPAPSGQSIDASSGPLAGFVPGQPQQTHIPRPSAVNPMTGERYAVR
jgi:hypothetical protein